MKNLIINISKLLFILACVFRASFACACALSDSCMVVMMNSDNIYIGNQRIKEGLVFDIKEKIIWSSDEQAMVVYYLGGENKFKFETLCAVEFHSKNKSIYEYKHVSTMGMDTDDSDTIRYVFDTLRIIRNWKYNKVAKDEAWIYQEADTLTDIIHISEDGEEYLVPRSAFGRLTNKPVYLDINETDSTGWKYPVWRRLYVVPLPMRVP